jgi:hypothetical protein
MNNKHKVVHEPMVIRQIHKSSPAANDKMGDTEEKTHISIEEEISYATRFCNLQIQSRIVGTFDPNR